MKKSTYILSLLAVVLFSSCQGFNKLMNNPDQSYKYEAAKQYFAQGKYTKAETLLNDIIVVLKGSDKGEESLYMLGMSYYNDNESAYRFTGGNLTANQINFLKAVCDGAQKFSSAEVLKKYRLNSSANVFRLKEALSKKEIITFDADDRASMIDPMFEHWLKERYFK